jgi:hypothetical protein
MPATALAVDWTVAHNLIITALQNLDSSAVQLYVELLPAATAIPTDHLLTLAKAALPKCPAAYRTLISLPGAQQLSSDHIKELLVLVKSTVDDSEFAASVPILCSLPQASLMQRSTIIELLSGLLWSPHQTAASAVCDLLEQSIKPVQHVTQEQQQQQGQQQQEQAPGLSSGEVPQLLKTAVPHDGSSGSDLLAGMKRLCSMQCIKDTADAELITAVLAGVLEVICNPLWLGIYSTYKEPAALLPTTATAAAGGTVRLLLGLPAAARIPAHQLVMYTDTVLGQCRDEDVCEAIVRELMCGGNVRLPGPNMLLRLLQSCLQRKAGRGIAACVELLCGDPAAQQLQAHSVLELLQSAVRLRWLTPDIMLRMVQALGQLPGSMQLTAEQVASLLSAAMNRSCSSSSNLLAASQRSSAANNISQMVLVLCGLPGAQGLQPWQLSRLLDAAVQGGYNEASRALFALPGAEHL